MRPSGRGSSAIFDSVAQFGTSAKVPRAPALWRRPLTGAGATLKADGSPVEVGRVLGTEPVGVGRTLVKAEIPELEITRYAIDLRSVSHGTGSFTRSYLRHEPLPSHLASKVAADSKPG